MYDFFETVASYSTELIDEKIGKRIITSNLIFWIGTVKYIWSGTNTSGGNIWKEKVIPKYGEGNLPIGDRLIYVKVFPKGGAEFDKTTEVGLYFLRNICDFLENKIEI